MEIGAELDIRVAVSSLPDLKGTERDQAAVLVQVRRLPSRSGHSDGDLHFTKKNPQNSKPEQYGTIAVQV